MAVELRTLARVHGFVQLGAPLPGEFVVGRFVEGRRLDLELRLARLLNQLPNGPDDLAAGAVPDLDRFEDIGFGDFFRLGLDHDNSFVRGRDDDAEISVLELRIAGVDDPFAFDATYPDRADCRHERNRRDRQSRRGSGQSQRAGVKLRVGREHHGDHLRLVAKPFGEQRTDRPVNQPAGEHFFFRGAPLALDVAARKPAGRVGVFAVVHREREKADPLARMVRCGRRYQNGRLSAGDQD